MRATWCSSTRPARDSAICAGADKEKAFYGVDQDAHAFANFIVEFLSRHGRWNSPKYLFGESYGTTRSAVLANILEQEKSLDLNGVILLSQILNFDDSADGPQFNPGVDLPYELVLPTYTATAWYHHKLPNQPAALEPLAARSREVRPVAITRRRLAPGAALTAERKSAIAARLQRLYRTAGGLHREAPICASTAGSSRRSCWAARPRPGGSTPASPGRPSTR